MAMLTSRTSARGRHRRSNDSRWAIGHVRHVDRADRRPSNLPGRSSLQTAAASQCLIRFVPLRHRWSSSWHQGHTSTRITWLEAPHTWTDIHDADNYGTHRTIRAADRSLSDDDMEIIHEDYQHGASRRSGVSDDCWHRISGGGVQRRRRLLACSRPSELRSGRAAQDLRRRLEGWSRSQASLARAGPGPWLLP